MKMELPPGTAVNVQMDDGHNYVGQVMFTHYGNPQRVMVAWLGDAPPGHHEIADWVEVERCSRDSVNAGSGSINAESSGGGGHP